jgi:hypothetical protein
MLERGFTALKHGDEVHAGVPERGDCNVCGCGQHSVCHATAGVVCAVDQWWLALHGVDPPVRYDRSWAGGWPFTAVPPAHPDRVMLMAKAGMGVVGNIGYRAPHVRMNTVFAPGFPGIPRQ